MYAQPERKLEINRFFRYKTLDVRLEIHTWKAVLTLQALGV